LTRVDKQDNFDGLSQDDQEVFEQAVSTETVTPLRVTKTIQQIPQKRTSISQDEKRLKKLKEEMDVIEARLEAARQATSSKASIQDRDIKPLPRSKGKKKQIETAKLPQLPLEIILDILEQSASSSSTKHARNVCLVSKKAYRACRHALHRIIAIRSASQFKAFAQEFVNGIEGESKRRLIARQDALESLYINNIPEDISKTTGCGTFLTMVLTNARNLKRCHFEEHWSDTNS